jgi:cyclophilin family peptidyl-prolyl cis-trans isomerase
MTLGSDTPQPSPRPTVRNIGTLILLSAITAAIIGVAVGLAVTGGKSASRGNTTTTSAGVPPSSTPTSSTPASSTTSSVPTSTFPVPSTLPLTTAAVASTCPAAGSTKRVVWFSKAPPDCISRTSVWDVTFDTSEGSFVIEMQAAKSYAAVNNFVFLTGWHYFDGTFFHRVIPGFVVQGGDPTGLGTGGSHGLPGYTYTGNTPPKSCAKTPGPSCYQIGDIALANTGAPTSDGSQFFLVLPGGQKVLDTEPNYTDFGHVTSGLNVLEKIGTTGSSSGTPSVKVYVLSVTATEVHT